MHIYVIIYEDLFSKTSEAPHKHGIRVIHSGNMDFSTAKYYGSDRIRTSVTRVSNTMS